MAIEWKIEVKISINLTYTGNSTRKCEISQDNTQAVRVATREFPWSFRHAELDGEACSLIFMRAHVDVVHDLGLNGGSIGQPREGPLS